jgi:transcriptional regulator with PAS, ATPase and Fis domain
MDALCRYHWPGNVRELQNVIQQTDGAERVETIQKEKLTDPKNGGCEESKPVSFAERKASVIAEFEKHYLDRCSALTTENVTTPPSEAARIAVPSVVDKEVPHPTSSIVQKVGSKKVDSIL